MLIVWKGVASVRFQCPLSVGSAIAGARASE